MMKDIYVECPEFNKKFITLKRTCMEDIDELLNCYSDEKAVPFFNSDNCNGDNFYYTTKERMEEAIDFWMYAYEKKWFARWTIYLNESNKRIGTIEMFHRIAEDEFNHYGVLRIDLQSNCETQLIIGEVLDIANDNFYEAFNVEAILTKAIPGATERIASLSEKGYYPLNKKLVVYDDYFVRYNNR